MSVYYMPPPMIYSVEENSSTYGKPLFYEYNGQIINLSAATRFYVDHIPLTSLYWPCASIRGTSYQLSSAVSSQEEAMNFLRDLTEKIRVENSK